MQMLVGYVYNFTNNYDNARTFYEDSLKIAADCSNERSKELALCNIGVIEAEKDFDQFMTGLGYNDVEIEGEEEKEKNEEIDYHNIDYQGNQGNQEQQEYEGYNENEGEIQGDEGEREEEQEREDEIDGEDAENMEQ